MSHWKGTWRKKEYEFLEKRVIKHSQIYDKNSLNVGKNDEELLRIYYFRNNQQKIEITNVSDPLKAKKQWQKLVQDTNQYQEVKEEENLNSSHEEKGKKDTQNQNNFFNSSSSQFSNLSNFSYNKKFQK